MTELREVLKSGKLNPPTAYIDSFEEELLRVATLVVPSKKIDIIKEDPDDNKVLECAIEGNVDYIISGDRHLLKLKEYSGIRIVRASWLLKIVE